MGAITADDIAIQDDFLDEALTIRSDINTEGCYRTAALEANRFIEKGMGREDAIWQATQMVEAALREIVASRKPWATDSEMKTAFETAASRYANLIGITDPDDDEVMQAFFEQDKTKYPEMIKTAPPSGGGDELPVFDEGDAVRPMMDITGQPQQICKDWLAYDWSA